MYNEKYIIDVTKPPYNVDNTGKVDCTETLCAIIDDILRPNIEGLEIAKKKLAAILTPRSETEEKHENSKTSLCYR